MDLTGVIDLHVHTAPDVYERRLDDVELAQCAAAAGMGAVMLKSHHTLTADRAAIAAKQTGLPVFGGLALNLAVGGINSVAVETAIAMGARQIWMPTTHAANCLENAEMEMFRAEARKGRAGIAVLDGDGAVRSDLLPVLEMIRDADIILGTGHLAPRESLAVLKVASDIGVQRMLVTHPNMQFTRFTHEQMHAAVDLGAVLEFDYLACLPQWHRHDPDDTARAIHAVGHRHCILASDGGQTFNPDPPTMLMQFAAAMRQRGIDDEQLAVMMRDNPARMLNMA